MRINLLRSYAHHIANILVKCLTAVGIGLFGFCVPIQVAVMFTGVHYSNLLSVGIMGMLMSIIVAMALSRQNPQRTTNRVYSHSAESEAIAELAIVKKQLREMEERLANVETISRFEHRLIQEQESSATQLSEAKFQFVAHE